MNAVLFSARLLEFNLLPSLTLHPSRHEAFGAPSRPVPAVCSPAWHRHWSAAILRRLSLRDRPVIDAARPELALALLPPDRLARLARHLGAVCCAPCLRRTIAGDEVRELAAALGVDALDFARRAETGPWSLPADQDLGPVATLAARVDRIGRTALRAVFQAAGPELGLRADLKLEDDPETGEPEDVRVPPDLTLAVLETIEPTWHSSFLAMR
ncbi:MAG: SctK family type III secretion system sorting platform protein [Castellaniella sp.]|uniref:SctK family type III secretion system sorting platform protein n=2 Tax=Castellaniella sp. TaxID=1955812 RepID=UPI003C7170E9